MTGEHFPRPGRADDRPWQLQQELRAARRVIRITFAACVVVGVLLAIFGGLWALFAYVLGLVGGACVAAAAQASIDIVP